MNGIEKHNKVISAIANALKKKDNTTDILYHLKKEFPDLNVKKMFLNLFNKEYLKDENLVNEKQSEIDSRKKEYRLDELHKLYVKYVKECQKHLNVNCKKIVEFIIIHEFFQYLDKEYDILEKIEKELIKTFTPQKERDRVLLSFMSSNTTFEEDIYEYIYKVVFIDIKKSIDIEKLSNEISILKKIISELNIK